MKKFLVERFLPGIEKHPTEKILKGVVRGTEILKTMGPDIKWVTSYVMPNRLYCIYMAKNEEILREYLNQSGRPCNCVGEVVTTLDPTMIEENTA